MIPTSAEAAGGDTTATVMAATTGPEEGQAALPAVEPSEGVVVEQHEGEGVITAAQEEEAGPAPSAARGPPGASEEAR